VPTPSLNRFPVSAATEEASFATITGLRMGSFRTHGTNMTRVVTAPIAGMTVNASRNGLSSKCPRVPPSLYGYFELVSRGKNTLSETLTVSYPAASATRAAGT
jgi:hypothetical protein